jgi:hypothetical protein
MLQITRDGNSAQGTLKGNKPLRKRRRRLNFKIIEFYFDAYIYCRTTLRVLIL